MIGDHRHRWPGRNPAGQDHGQHFRHAQELPVALLVERPPHFVQELDAFDVAWQRIGAHGGKEFRTKIGIPRDDTSIVPAELSERECRIVMAREGCIESSK